METILGRVGNSKFQINLKIRPFFVSVESYDTLYSFTYRNDLNLQKIANHLKFKIKSNSNQIIFELDEPNKQPTIDSWGALSAGTQCLELKEMQHRFHISRAIGGMQ